MRLSFDNFGYQIDHLAGFGVAVGLQLGIDQLPVHADLEAAAIGGDQDHRLDQVLELFEQFASQAHGPVGVVSNRAVDDLDLQHKPPVSR
jgi:hypothetical protein